MRNINEITKIPEKPLHETVTLGNGTAITMLVFQEDGLVHLAVEGKGYYTFDNYCHPNYLWEKVWNRQNIADVEIVSDWMNKVMGWDFNYN